VTSVGWAQAPLFGTGAMDPEEDHPLPNNVLTDSDDEESSHSGSDSSDTHSVGGHGPDNCAPEVDHPPPNAPV
jgi:hypothetical protein